MAANKGGIGFSLQVNDTKIAFVTAHLAAGKFVWDASVLLLFFVRFIRGEYSCVFLGIRSNGR